MLPSSSIAMMESLPELAFPLDARPTRHFKPDLVIQCHARQCEQIVAKGRELLVLEFVVDAEPVAVGFGRRFFLFDEEFLQIL